MTKGDDGASRVAMRLAGERYEAGAVGADADADDAGPDAEEAGLSDD